MATAVLFTSFCCLQDSRKLDAGDVLAPDLGLCGIVPEGPEAGLLVLLGRLDKSGPELSMLVCSLAQ